MSLPLPSCLNLGANAKRPAIFAGLICLAAGGLRCAAAPAAAFAPFLEERCIDCHDSDVKKGGLDLTSLGADLSKPEVMRVWVRIHDRVQAGEMPPPKKTQPEPAERDRFITALAADLTRADMDVKGTVLRRLNRVEYEHTLRDLLGVATDLQTLLPEDGKAFGFDNVGEALDLSPVHLQRYMDAAHAALRDAVRFGPAPERKAVVAPFDAGRNAENIGKHWHKLDDGSVVFFNDGGFPSITPEFAAPVEGRYRVTVRGRAYQSDKDVGFSVYAGTFGRNSDTHLLSVMQVPSKPTERTVDVYLREREKLRFIPQLAAGRELRENGPAAYQGAGLALMPVEIDGPMFEEWPGRGHQLLFGGLEARETAESVSKNKYRNKGNNLKRAYEVVVDDPAAAAKRLLGGFVPAAFRRPVSEDKIEPYLKLMQDELAGGAAFQDAMMTAYVAVLCAPDFLYLKEPSGRLDDFAVAARLSYMLWSTAPDDELLNLAASKLLSKPAALRAQTERMLSDARSERFIKNFTGQWLNLRDIDFTTPDRQLYPEYDDALKDASLKETELFFGEVLRRNLNVENFIDSDWTMLNERLARHYGIDGVEGAEFRRVGLTPEHHRGGVLTQMSVLKVSANGTTTSPVVRGAWVLDRILGSPPPPPPPGVPGVEPDIRGAQTLRQQLDKHRNLETCNGCHRIIDPPGFALENYDVIGGWRENYRSLGKDFPKPTQVPPNVRFVQWRVGPPVDASGTSPDGAAFQNLADYKKVLLAHPERFTRALAGKLAVYATGRGMGFSDRPELDQVTAEAIRKGNGLREVVHAIVQSEIFSHK